MKEDITLRMATEADASQLLAIYTPYVTDTPITFDYSVPNIKDFEIKIRHILERYPFIVAFKDDIVLGYTYVSALRERAAYDWAVETSVYIKREYRGRGIGKKLYQKLEEIVIKQNIINMYACIAYPNPESIAFHESMGYKTVGHFHKCGYKLHKWYDIVWMEKVLDVCLADPQPVTPIKKLTIDY